MLFGTLLLIQRSGAYGSRFPITMNVSIGSGEGNDIRLKVPDVARQQCRIITNQGTKKLIVKAIDDTLGQTLVNGALLRANDQKEIFDGDILSVSGRLFKLSHSVSGKSTSIRETSILCSTLADSSGKPGIGAKKLSRSIFDRTPPEATSNASTTSFSISPMNCITPKQASPKPRKSILSTKKNVLVARMPTISPKNVRWAEMRHEVSLASPRGHKPIKRLRRSLGASTSHSGSSMKKRHSVCSSSLLLPNERHESDVPTFISRGYIDSPRPLTLSTPTASLQKSDLEPKENSPGASFTDFSVSEISETIKTSTSGKRLSATPETLSEKPVRHSSASFKNNNEPSKTRLSESFAAVSPTVDNASQSIVSNANSVATPPSDSFGSLSVSDVDRSAFYESPSDTNRLTFESSGTICSSVSPMSDSNSLLSKTLTNSHSSENTDAIIVPEGNSGSQAGFEILTSMIAHKVALPGVLSVNNDDQLTRAPAATIQGRKSKETFSSAEKTEKSKVKKSLSNSIVSESSKVTPMRSRKSHTAEVLHSQKGTPVLPAVNTNKRRSFASKSNRENSQAGSKTWAGVLKASIASGSPFRVKNKSGSSFCAPSQLLKQKQQKAAQAVSKQTRASYISTGHALSPQTLYVGRRKSGVHSDASTALSTKPATRRSSLGDQTLNIEPDIFVSPLQTPDKTEGVLRAQNFLSGSTGNNSLTSNGIGSNKSSINEQDASISPAGVRLGQSLKSPAEIEKKSTKHVDGGGPVDLPSVANGRVSRRSSSTVCTSSPSLVIDEGSYVDNTISAAIGAELDQSMHKEAEVSTESLTSKQGVLLTNQLAKKTDSATKVRTARRLQSSSKNENVGYVDVEGVRRLFRTPRPVSQPSNNLDNFIGVKKLLKTPVESIKSETEVTSEHLTGVRRVFRLRTSVISSIEDVSGVKKLFRTPKKAKAQKSPLNVLDDLKGVKKLYSTPRQVESPLNSLEDVRGIKTLFKSPVVGALGEDILENFDGFQNLVKSLNEKATSPSSLESNFRASTPRESSKKRATSNVSLSLPENLEASSYLLEKPIKKLNENETIITSVSNASYLTVEPDCSSMKRDRKRKSVLSEALASKRVKDNIKVGDMSAASPEGDSSDAPSRRSRRHSEIATELIKDTTTIEKQASFVLIANDEKIKSDVSVNQCAPSTEADIQIHPKKRSQGRSSQFQERNDALLDDEDDSKVIQKNAPLGTQLSDTSCKRRTSNLDRDSSVNVIKSSRRSSEKKLLPSPKMNDLTSRSSHKSATGNTGSRDTTYAATQKLRDDEKNTGDRLDNSEATQPKSKGAQEKPEVNTGRGRLRRKPIRDISVNKEKDVNEVCDSSKVLQSEPRKASVITSPPVASRRAVKNAKIKHKAAPSNNALKPTIELSEEPTRPIAQDASEIPVLRGRALRSKKNAPPAVVNEILDEKLETRVLIVQNDNGLNIDKKDVEEVDRLESTKAKTRASASGTRSRRGRKPAAHSANAPESECLSVAVKDSTIKQAPTSLPSKKEAPEPPTTTVKQTRAKRKNETPSSHVAEVNLNAHPPADVVEHSTRGGTKRRRVQFKTTVSVSSAVVESTGTEPESRARQTRSRATLPSKSTKSSDNVENTLEKKALFDLNTEPSEVLNVRSTKQASSNKSQRGRRKHKINDSSNTSEKESSDFIDAVRAVDTPTLSVEETIKSKKSPSTSVNRKTKKSEKSTSQISKAEPDQSEVDSLPGSLSKKINKSEISSPSEKTKPVRSTRMNQKNAQVESSSLKPPKLTTRKKAILSPPKRVTRARLR